MLWTFLDYITKEGNNSFRNELVFDFENEFANAVGCFASSKLDTNVLDRLIYKYTFNDNPIDSSKTIWVASRQFLDINANLITDDLLVGEQYRSNDTFNVSNIDFDFYNTTIIGHKEDGFPSDENKSITYITPENNTDYPQTINYKIQYTVQLFQPFTMLQGGYILNSDSIQHTLNLEYGDDIFCFPVVERIAERNTNLVYHGGKIEFASPQGCFQLRNKSKLIVTKGNTLTFGEDGFGMLNIRSGGTIELQENATFNFAGNLVLNAYEGYFGEQDVYLDLPKTTTLNFMEHAKITNYDPSFKLNVRMLGGTINYANLSLEDRQKINLIYPEEKLLENTIEIYPNPTSNNFIIQQLTGESQISLMSLKGQLLMNTTTNENQIEIATTNLPVGVYVLRIQSEGKVTSQKVVVQ